MIFEGTDAEGAGVVSWGPRGRRHAFAQGDYPARAAALRKAHLDGLRRSMRWLDDGRRSDAAAKGPRGQVPRAQERQYEGMLLQRVALVGRLVSSMVLPELVEWRADAEYDPRRLVRALGLVRAIRSVLGDLGADDERGLRYLGNATEEKVSTSVDEQLTRLFTIPIATAAPSGLVDDWVQRNAQLITSIPTQYLNEIEELINRGVREGAPIRQLRDTIRGRFGVTRSRASLIARDQTAKLTGAIARHRHQRYGIEEYVWSTSGDGRVRQAHADLDGTVQRYDTPPVADSRGNTGHPGELWQCRCTARPIRPQDDVEGLRAEAVARQEREAQLLSQSPTVRGDIPNRSGFTDWNRARLRELRAGGNRARRAVGLR